MSESAAGAIGNILFVGVPKFLLNIGGLVLIAWGLFSGLKWSLVVLGVLAIVLGQIIHAIDGAVFDRKLVRWAETAVNDVGPLPPRDVRKVLARKAVGSHDFVRTFMELCSEWSQAAGQVDRSER